MPCRCDQCDHLYIYPELPFLDPPRLADVYADPAAEWIVACNYLGPLIDGRATLIRRRFTVDGASIPQAVWSIVGHPFQMPLLAYALIHDGDCAAELFPFDETDARFKKGMELDGHISQIKRRVVYRAVVDYHTLTPNRHTPESISDARRYCRGVAEEEYFALAASRTLPAA